MLRRPKTMVVRAAEKDAFWYTERLSEFLTGLRDEVTGCLL